MKLAAPRSGSTPVALAFAVTLVLLVPGGLASHWTVQNAVDPDAVHRTGEDDSRSVFAPGNVFDGVGNRVSPIGRVPGDGSLFLDALLGNIVGQGEGTSFTVSTGAFLEPVTNDRSVLLPGLLRASAWYGQWLDLNEDGVIDDVHDAASAPADEFKWRGVGSDAPVALPLYTIPSTQVSAQAAGAGTSLATGIVGAGDHAGYSYQGLLRDRTSYSEASQEWVQNGFIHWVDAPLLAQVHVILIAGAPPIVGAEPGYDLKHTDALIDVDIYHSVSPELESLWANVARTIVHGRGDDPEVPEIPDAPEIKDPVDTSDILSSPTGILIGASAPVLAEVNDAVARLTPWDVKEPNHADDDYGGLANYGGVGDVRGSGNTYDAYADGYHYFLDAFPRTRTCPGVWAGVPGTSVATRSTIICSTPGHAEEPVAGRFADSRSTGTFLTFEAASHLWKDKNRDTYHGNRCTPGTDSWDTANNTCAASSTPRTNGHNSNAEAIGICPTTTARNGVLTIAPVNGAWEGAYLFTDYEEMGRGVIEGTARLLLGHETVPIRFHTECIGTGLLVVARDALAFPKGGPASTLRSEMSASSTGYVDNDLGIEVESESILDVDHLHPVL